MDKDDEQYDSETEFVDKMERLLRRKSTSANVPQYRDDEERMMAQQTLKKYRGVLSSESKIRDLKLSHQNTMRRINSRIQMAQREKAKRDGDNGGQSMMMGQSMLGGAGMSVNHYGGSASDAPAATPSRKREILNAFSFREKSDAEIQKDLQDAIAEREKELSAYNSKMQELQETLPQLSTQEKTIIRGVLAQRKSGEMTKKRGSRTESISASKRTENSVFIAFFDKHRRQAFMDLKHSEIMDLATLFQTADVNSSGAVEEDDFVKLIRRLLCDYGITQAEAERIAMLCALCVSEGFSLSLEPFFDACVDLVSLLDQKRDEFLSVEEETVEELKRRQQQAAIDEKELFQLEQASAKRIQRIRGESTSSMAMQEEQLLHEYLIVEDQRTAWARKAVILTPRELDRLRSITVKERAANNAAAAAAASNGNNSANTNGAASPSRSRRGHPIFGGGDDSILDNNRSVQIKLTPSARSASSEPNPAADSNNGAPVAAEDDGSIIALVVPKPPPPSSSSGNAVRKVKAPAPRTRPVASAAAQPPPPPLPDPEPSAAAKARYRESLRNALHRAPFPSVRSMDDLLMCDATTESSFHSLFTALAEGASLLTPAAIQTLIALFTPCGVHSEEGLHFLEEECGEEARQGLTFTMFIKYGVELKSRLFAAEAFNELSSRGKHQAIKQRLAAVQQKREDEAKRQQEQWNGQRLGFGASLRSEQHSDVLTDFAEEEIRSSSMSRQQGRTNSQDRHAPPSIPATPPVMRRYEAVFMREVGAMNQLRLSRDATTTTAATTTAAEKTNKNSPQRPPLASTVPPATSSSGNRQLVPTKLKPPVPTQRSNSLPNASTEQHGEDRPVWTNEAAADHSSRPGTAPHRPQGKSSRPQTGSSTATTAKTAPAGARSARLQPPYPLGVGERQLPLLKWANPPKGEMSLMMKREKEDDTLVAALRITHLCR